MKYLPLMVTMLLLIVAGCDREPFPDICTLDKAHIRFGTTVKVRAILVGGFTPAITGRRCARTFEFTVRDYGEWGRKQYPAELLDYMNSTFQESARRNLVVEADLILELSKVPHPFEGESPPVGDAHIKGAKNFALVPSPF